MSNLESLLKTAEKQITIIGINPLRAHLDRSAQVFFDILVLHKELRINILYESDTENFNQSLCVDTPTSTNRTPFSSLSVHRDRIAGNKKGGGLITQVLNLTTDVELQASLRNRLVLQQVNLRVPLNVIAVDDNFWFCVVTNQMPTFEDYELLTTGSRLYIQVKSLVSFYTAADGGQAYLSRPGEELIQFYDKNKFPRGILPRSSFYTTAFQRYSVWGFIFNRKGQLLLHQRSQTAKDGRGLWDKSIGGHVDLRDSSTFMTAQRELVEELFLPEAEYSKYMQADFGDIINFGDWNSSKRKESTFKSAFEDLGDADWVMFRMTNEQGDPLTISRVSSRRIHDEKGVLNYKKTIFMSDLYLFIAPSDLLDTHEQMKELFKVSEAKGAAQDHKLVTLSELSSWIAEMEAKEKEETTFTDDLLYINAECRDVLERFSEFIRYTWNVSE